MFGNRDFSIGDAFVGFHEDTIPSIVMQVCNEIEREDHSSPSHDAEYTLEMKVSFMENVILRYIHLDGFCTF